MNPNLTRGLAAAGLAALLASASVSLAQPAPASAPAQAAPADRQMHRPDPAAMAARRAEHLRTVLQLRPDQEGALKAFLDVAKPPAGAREARRKDHHEMAALTTPQRLERRKAMMAERQARFDQRAAATLRFYAQLSPAQQKAFDALASDRRGKWGGRGRHGGGHHDGPHHGGPHHGGMDDNQG